MSSSDVGGTVGRHASFGTADSGASYTVRPILLLSLLGALPLGAQDVRTVGPERILLVGRNETASIDLTRVTGGTVDDLVPWQQGAPPLAPGASTRALLWNDLPITIGDAVIPPGRHRLWIQDTATLVVTRELPPEATRFDESDVQAKVTMSVTPAEGMIPGWLLDVRTWRVGEDTLSTRENRRGTYAVVVTVRHLPGTRSELHLRWRDRLLTAPISAR